MLDHTGENGDIDMSRMINFVNGAIVAKGPHAAVTTYYVNGAYISEQ